MTYSFIENNLPYLLYILYVTMVKAGEAASTIKRANNNMFTTLTMQPKRIKYLLLLLIPMYSTTGSTIKAAKRIQIQSGSPDIGPGPSPGPGPGPKKNK